MDQQSSSPLLSVADGYDRWAPTYDRVANSTRDAATNRLLNWASFFRGKDVLELGCGTGRNTALIAQWAASVAALDFSAGMLSEAARRPDCSGVRFLTHDVTTALPSETATHDVVLESLVLEHIRELAPVFSEVFRVLRPGGDFFGSELHPYQQSLGKQARFQPPGSTEEVLIEAHRHSDSEFVNVALAAGFHVLQLEEDEDPTGALRLFSFHFRKLP
jgi:ubiquinone/menaquinone biosynthesis C-methylase UbiE